MGTLAGESEWTVEEDDRLVAYIQFHGEDCWESLPEGAGLLSKSGHSCRLRWMMLQLGLKPGNLTEEDEEVIIALDRRLGYKGSRDAVRIYWDAYNRRKLLIKGIDPYTHGPMNMANPRLFEERTSSTNAEDSGFWPFDDSAGSSASRLSESGEEALYVIQNALLSDDPSEWDSFGRVKLIKTLDTVGANNVLPERCPRRIETPVTKLALDQQQDIGATSQRWMNNLQPDLKGGNFTEEEEELIIKLHSLFGNKWSLIARRLPGQNGDAVRNYWNVHIRRKMLSRGIDPCTHRPIKTANPRFEKGSSSTNTENSGFWTFVFDDSAQSSASHLSESKKETLDVIQNAWLSVDHAFDQVELILQPDAVEANNDLPERCPPRIETPVTTKE